MPTVMSNRDLAQELQRNPGDHQLVVFAYAPVDVNAVPDDTVIVPMHIVPLDWRHVIECQVVIAHDGRHLSKPSRAAQLCMRFAPWELLMWNVIHDRWICVKDGAGKMLKRVPGVW